MNYPHAVATGNQVIAAAVALAAVHIPKTSTFPITETVAFLDAVAAHQAATVRPQETPVYTP